MSRDPVIGKALNQYEVLEPRGEGGVVSDGVRVITAAGQLFDLDGPDQVFGGGGQCSNVSMSFRFTVERFDTNAGS